MSKTLKLAIILGSVREGRAGDKVGAYLASMIRSLKHEAVIIDPLEANLPLVNKPHHWYRPGEEVPPVLSSLSKTFKESDGFLIVTPEYNGFPAPALVNLMDHFGSGEFGKKPMAICTYSAGLGAGTLSFGEVQKTFTEAGPTEAMKETVDVRTRAFLDDMLWYTDALKLKRDQPTA
ncbi:hypothetical protein RI367_001917 [Sorochytrium milnesiophthora]